MTLIQSCLKKGYHYAYADQKIFNEWVDGVISLQECKEKFVVNNDIPIEKKYLLTDEMFEEWLLSIGWYR